MTRTEALAALGLPSVPDAKSLRRAYLRAVKAHSPERDPDGFQQVRAAYELLERFLPAVVRTPRPRAERMVSPPVQPPVAQAPVEVAPVREPPLEAMADEPLPVPRPWEPPAPPDVTPWVLTPPAPEAPQMAPADRLARANEQAVIEPDAALADLEQALADLTVARTSEVHPAEVLVPALLLQRAGHVAVARKATLAVERWLVDTGRATRLTPAVSAQLILARELAELPTHFPLDVRFHLAGAVMDNDLVGAQPALFEFGRSQPLRAREALFHLELHAPNLVLLFGPILVPPATREDRRQDTPPPGPPVDWQIPRVVLALLLLLGITVRACTLLR